MPHVDIKCFPRELTDEQKTALAADITEVLIHNGRYGWHRVR
jgi:4-oxalocrotonate tautomerase